MTFQGLPGPHPRLTPLDGGLYIPAMAPLDFLFSPARLCAGETLSYVFQTSR